MKLVHTIIIFLVSFLLAQSQPVLVEDFLDGISGSYNILNYKGIALGESLIFPIIGNDIGEELAVLQNGELSALKDINEGTGSSEPKHFVQFDDKIYFSAFDDTNGGAIWTSDGTTEGTVMAFDPGSSPDARPEGLITTTSGFLYYTYDNQLFRTDGTTHENIFSGVDFRTVAKQASDNYCQFEDEIAFVTETLDYRFELYIVEGGVPILKGTTAATSGSADAYGLNRISQGLMFVLEDFFTSGITGDYVYEISSNTLELKISMDEGYAKRMHDFTDELALIWVEGSGYYTSNGISNEQELLFGSENTAFTQEVGIINAVFEDKVIFFAIEDFFIHHYLVYSDGTSNGTTILFETAAPYISNIIIHDKYAFVATGTDANPYIGLHYINMENGYSEEFYKFDEGANSSNTILLMGVQNDKLYFLSTLNSSVGRELYSIDLDFAVNTQKINPTHEVKFTSSSFEVVTENFADLDVSVYTSDGRLIEYSQKMTNTVYDISHLQGVFIIRFEVNGEFSSHKISFPY